MFIISNKQRLFGWFQLHAGLEALGTRRLRQHGRYLVFYELENLVRFKVVKERQQLPVACGVIVALN